MEKRAKIISICSVKSKVGKTTTVANLAYCLARLGEKVLVCDLSPQGNTSQLLGRVHPESQEKTIRDIFENDSDSFYTCRTKSKYKNVDIIPSKIDLSSLFFESGNSPFTMLNIKNALDEKTQYEYDVIIIDTPPSLEHFLLASSLMISDAYIIPIECETFYGLAGIQKFQKFIKIVKKSLNSDLVFLGAVITLYDSRRKASSAMVDQIKNYFGEGNTFQTVIPKNVTLKKAASTGNVICKSDTRASSCKAYRSLAQEIIPFIHS